MIPYQLVLLLVFGVPFAIVFAFCWYFASILDEQRTQEEELQAAHLRHDIYRDSASQMGEDEEQ